MRRGRDTGSGLTRRALLGGATALLAGCAGVRGRKLEELDSRVPSVLDAAVSVDMHSHAAGAGFARAPRYDLAAKMRQGQLSAVSLCHSADGPIIRRPLRGRLQQYRQPNAHELYEFTRQRLAFMDGLTGPLGLARVLTPEDLATAKAKGRPALIGTIEGCHFMDGRLERIAEVHRRGIRQLQIVHYALSELGDQQTEDARWGGLSPLGADAVRECNRLGIVVDVAHGTRQLVEQVARISAAPFVLSHTSLAPGPPAQYSRLISAEHARVVAQAGGVIGVWPAAYQFVDPQDWVSGIARLVDVAGVNHVGIGTDMEGGVNEVWDDYADFPAVVDLFLRRGFTPEETGKLIGGNYVRVFRQAAAARKEAA